MATTLTELIEQWEFKAGEFQNDQKHYSLRVILACIDDLKDTMQVMEAEEEYKRLRGGEHHG